MKIPIQFKDLNHYVLLVNLSIRHIDEVLVDSPPNSPLVPSCELSSVEVLPKVKEREICTIGSDVITMDHPPNKLASRLRRFGAMLKEIALRKENPKFSTTPQPRQMPTNCIVYMKTVSTCTRIYVSSQLLHHKALKNHKIEISFPKIFCHDL